MPLTAQFVTIKKHIVSKCHFSLPIASKHEVLMLFVWTHASKLLLWKFVMTDMWTCARQNRNGMCARLSLPIKHIANTLIRLGGWPRCGFVRFSMIFGPVRGRIACGWKRSKYSFQRWDSADFVHGPKGAHTCWFYRPCICPILDCKTGHRLFQSQYGVCTGPHCIRRDTFRNPWGHVQVDAILGQKSQEHTENRENACNTYIRRRVISYGLLTDHRLLWLRPSLTSRGTPMGL